MSAKRKRYRPMTCTVCMMRTWDFLRLQCESCGTTSEAMHRNRIAVPR